MTALMAALGAVEIDSVGTSLGGLIGMVLAGLPGSPIRRIVINDIGPYLPWAGLLRLGANLNEAPKSFETIKAAELYLRRVLAPFGELQDEHWHHLTIHGIEWKPERQRYESLCDPGYCTSVPQLVTLQRRPLEILGRYRRSYLGDQANNPTFCRKTSSRACCGETATLLRTL